MNIALWIAQLLLAAMYLAVGSMKVFQPAKVREDPRMTWLHGQRDHSTGRFNKPQHLVGLAVPADMRDEKKQWAVQSSSASSQWNDDRF